MDARRTFSISVAAFFAILAFILETNAAQPVYEAAQRIGDIRLRAEYSGGRSRMRGMEPFLRMTVQKGKERLAVCQSTQPITRDALRAIDFRCESTQLAGFATLATLLPAEQKLRFGSFANGYEDLRLREYQNQLSSLVQ